jgi:spore germination cell wall hydrolase CwlJ-like protein
LAAAVGIAVTGFMIRSKNLAVFAIWAVNGRSMINICEEVNMKNKTIQGLICLLTVIYVVMLIVSFEVKGLKFKEREAALIKQVADLRTENAELKETKDAANELINTQADLIDEIFMDLFSDEPEQEKNSRGGDREPRYKLSANERSLVEQVVMAEAGGEPYEGQMLVAQCILDACQIDGIRPSKAIEEYAYAKSRPKPTESVIRAVTAVFDRGETVVNEPILYFYAPDMVTSPFHESQQFVCEVGGHRFFVDKSNM